MDCLVPKIIFFSNSLQMDSYGGSTFTADMTVSSRELEWSNEIGLLVSLKLQNGNADVTPAQKHYIHFYRIQKYSQDKSLIS